MFLINRIKIQICDVICKNVSRDSIVTPQWKLYLVTVFMNKQINTYPHTVSGLTNWSSP